ncbi:nitroreductase/quinone reductase family protein [Gordonia sinesedis]
MTSSHYVPPAAADRAFGRIVRWLSDRGIGLAGAATLTVPGRISGRPQRIPVNPLPLDGCEYLVSIRGEAQWVRNARAAGSVEVRRGRRRRTVRVSELPVADRVPVLRAYLDRWGWEVGRFLPDGLTADATHEQVAAHAHLLPVLVVEE